MITWPTKGGFVNGLCTIMSINDHSSGSCMTNNTFIVNDNNTWGPGFLVKGPRVGLVNELCTILLIDDHLQASQVANNTFTLNDGNTQGLGLGGQVTPRHLY